LKKDNYAQQKAWQRARWRSKNRM